MKIGVTGSTGFIGRRLAPLLRSRMHEVVDLPRTPMSDSLTECDVLIHLAARIPDGTDLSDEIFDRDNLALTQAWVHFLPKSVKQVVFASTLDVYGPPQTLPLTEQHPLNPVTPYARAKTRTEEWLQEAVPAGNRRLVIVRLSQVYGPGERPIKTIPKTIDALLHGRSPVMYGDGTELRDYLYVDDAAMAFALATEKGFFGIVNAATGTSVPIKNVISIIQRIIGPSAEIDQRERTIPAYDITFDITKLRTELGFSPSISLEDGLRAQIDAARSLSNA